MKKEKRFSIREGFKPVRAALQVGGMDVPLRNRIYNVLIEDFFDHLDTHSQLGPPYEFEIVCTYIWTDYFEKPIDELPQFTDRSFWANGFRDFFKEWYAKASFDSIYDFVEYTITLEEAQNSYNVRPAIERVLEREMAGYRLIGNAITPITNEQEVQEIEKAIGVTGMFAPVAIQLKNALDLLSDRNNPDYRNSVKDSISAVESLCALISGEPTATLGTALKKLEASHKLHPALKNAFNALYGYTSDAAGIRHGLLEDGIVLDQADAIFMLVTCSAFTNYMISKAT